MSGERSQDVELLLLCGKARDESLTPDDAKRLDELLQSSDRAKSLYVQYMSIVSLLESRGMSVAEPAAQASEVDDLFAELLAFEQAAEAEVVEPPKAVGAVIKSETKPWQIGGALCYLANRPAVWGVVAAVLAFALLLVVVFIGGPAVSPVAEDTVNTPSSSPQAVATLTAEHAAVWAEGALARGSQLRAGQRMTLTQGFAEITTVRGAVVILEAPATIELTESDNAIRLHTGKLVGICEADSSKGFVVTTPAARIVDIGTHFGINATPESTQVQVYKGSVHASLLHNSGIEPSPVLVTARQALLLRADEVPRRVTFDPQRDTTALKLASRILTEVHDPASIPADLRPGVVEADALQIFVEHKGLTLTQHLPVDLHVSGQAVQAKWTDAPAVPAGSRVDVYLLHFDPVDVAGRRIIDGDFTARFDRPIVAVVGSAPLLHGSDKILKRETTRYPQERINSSLEKGEFVNFKVSPDGRSLQFKLTVGDQFIDQLRVITETEDAGS